MSNYVYKNLVRNRKNFFFIMIFSILITLFTVTLNFYQSYKKMINDGLKNDLLYRNILLAPVDKYGKQIQDIESLIKIDHIVDIHDIKYDSIDLYAKEYKNKNHEGIIEFSYGVESIKSIIGKSQISSGELICSKNFYPSFELAKNRKFFYNEEILNKSITIEEPIYRRVSGKYKDTKMKYVKTFKVASLYDPVVTGSTLNTCYATNEDMKEIYDTLYIDLNPDSLTSYVVTVDKYENVKEVIKSLRNKKIGFVFQNFLLNDYLTVIENVCLPLITNKKLSKYEKQNKALKILNQLNIESKSKRFPKELSGGEQQRVAIARALINDPDIILADEPTGNLDRDNENEVFKELKKLANAGKCVIVISHSQEILKYADKKYDIEEA